MDAVITAGKEQGAAALLAVDSADEDSSVDSGRGEALTGQGGDGAIDAVRDAPTAEASSMGSQGEGTDAGAEGQGRAPAVVPAKSAGEQEDDHRDVDPLEPDARTSAMESSSDFGSGTGAGASSGAGDDETTAPVGVDADVAAGANVDGDLETDLGMTEISASEWSGVDARPPRMPSGRWPSPQHRRATTGDAAAVPPDDYVSTSDSSQEVEALLLEEEEEEEASGEDFPRRRPVFRFSEPLSAGPDPVDVGLAGQRPPRRRHTADVEDFVVLPPLPPLDSISAEPPGEAIDPAGAMVGYSEENGWEAWAAELAVALRKASVRWAGVAAERGGVLAEELLEACKAQVVKSWHETVQPLAGYARRRLEATANFCLGEVGQHLEDAVTAEAL
ncbi:hypothetical protein Esi_0086_0073 [Ectocarpus siliculosus]|uniref:Uncharacterized protein n=1 Tax=Ectocarpus siliculosus TaxID=2880 RepID=D7G806_ECTSI|nr:hypothetical protein Esi_0086_0073 [Ectocarpus siliculosus]|eukprot:CBJ27881.1 hypothetical protein Esi_0086_0073 [Ectocarpus siliculosus]